MMPFKPSLVLPLECMVLLMVVFEPIRAGLEVAGWPVGGVGGVGGFVNFQNPDKCSSLAGRTGNYCFRPGIFLAFNELALVFMALWYGPLFLGAIATAVKGRSVAGPAESSGLAESESSPLSAEIMLKAWSYVSFLWFVVPFMHFIIDPLFHGNLVGWIMSVSLAAAFPLSWHLAFVAIPVSDTVAPWLGIPRSAVYTFHKGVGWRTAFWGAMHATGTLVWQINKGLWQYIRLSKREYGENVLYIMGMVCAVLLAGHTSIAYVRRRAWLAGAFKNVHRVTAGILLLGAATHWWPFALFLLPAASVYGCTAGEWLAGRTPTLARKFWSLAAAFVGAFVCLTVVWIWRQEVMGAPDVGMVVPFIFPPMALLAQGVGASVAAAIVCASGPKTAAGNRQSQQVELLRS